MKRGFPTTKWENPVDVRQRSINAQALLAASEKSIEDIRQHSRKEEGRGDRFIDGFLRLIDLRRNLYGATDIFMYALGFPINMRVDFKPSPPGAERYGIRHFWNRQAYLQSGFSLF